MYSRKQWFHQLSYALSPCLSSWHVSSPTLFLACCIEPLNNVYSVRLINNVQVLTTHFTKKDVYSSNGYVQQWTRTFRLRILHTKKVVKCRPTRSNGFKAVADIAGFPAGFPPVRHVVLPNYLFHFFLNATVPQTCEPVLLSGYSSLTAFYALPGESWVTCKGLGGKGGLDDRSGAGGAGASPASAFRHRFFSMPTGTNKTKYKKREHETFVRTNKQKKGHQPRATALPRML